MAITSRPVVRVDSWVGGVAQGAQSPGWYLNGQPIAAGSPVTLTRDSDITRVGTGDATWAGNITGPHLVTVSPGAGNTLTVSGNIDVQRFHVQGGTVRVTGTIQGSTTLVATGATLDITGAANASTFLGQITRDTGATIIRRARYEDWTSVLAWWTTLQPNQVELADGSAAVAFGQFARWRQFRGNTWGALSVLNAASNQWTAQGVETNGQWGGGLRWLLPSGQQLVWVTAPYFVLCTGTYRASQPYSRLWSASSQLNGAEWVLPFSIWVAGNGSNSAVSVANDAAAPAASVFSSVPTLYSFHMRQAGTIARRGGVQWSSGTTKHDLDAVTLTLGDDSTNDSGNGSGLCAFREFIVLDGINGRFETAEGIAAWAAGVQGQLVASHPYATVAPKTTISDAGTTIT